MGSPLRLAPRLRRRRREREAERPVDAPRRPRGRARWDVGRAAAADGAPSLDGARGAQRERRSGSSSPSRRSSTDVVQPLELERLREEADGREGLAHLRDRVEAAALVDRARRHVATGGERGADGEDEARRRRTSTWGPSSPSRSARPSGRRRARRRSHRRGGAPAYPARLAEIKEPTTLTRDAETRDASASTKSSGYDTAHVVPWRALPTRRRSEPASIGRSPGRPDLAPRSRGVRAFGGDKSLRAAAAGALRCVVADQRGAEASCNTVFDRPTASP